MSRDFVIADLHFGHENIIKYENRPFLNTEDMNKEIIVNWNNKVSKQDRVFVLGDVSFTNKEETNSIIQQLNGHKILIMGNHDSGRSIKWWLETGFDEVYKYPIILNEFIILSHEPPAYYNENTPYFYIYGHVHGSEMYQTITKHTACVSVERWNYTPVDMDYIKTLVLLKN